MGLAPGSVDLLAQVCGHGVGRRHLCRDGFSPSGQQVRVASEFASEGWRLQQRGSSCAEVCLLACVSACLFVCFCSCAVSQDRSGSFVLWRLAVDGFLLDYSYVLGLRKGKCPDKRRVTEGPAANATNTIVRAIPGCPPIGCCLEQAILGWAPTTATTLLWRGVERGCTATAAKWHDQGRAYLDVDL